MVRYGWGPPLAVLGALSGAVVVLAFTVVHDILISDIWFNAGPMVFAGGLTGLCIVWAYNRSVTDHSSAAWFQFAAILTVELIVLGAASLIVLSPEFSMAELMVADDAFERLLPPSMPLIIGAMVVGTASMWIYYGRKPAALIPLFVTQVLLVFLIGHQFAFLGLVETTTALLMVFIEFGVITAGLAAVYCLGVIGGAVAIKRLRRNG